MTIDGSLYIWGYAILNQYRANAEYIQAPRLLMSHVKDVKSYYFVRTGTQYIVILNTAGELYLMGKIYDNDKNRTEPEIYLNNVSQIVSAEDNVVVLMFDGTYYSTSTSFHDDANFGLMITVKEYGFYQIRLDYEGQDVTQNLKDVKISAWSGYYLLTNGKLLQTIQTDIRVVDDDVTLFYVREFDEDELLFVAKNSILHSYDINQKKVKFELDSKIIKIRLHEPEPDQGIAGLYVLTENGTLYVHRYVDDDVLSNLDEYKGMGLIVEVDIDMDVPGNFAPSPIPILKDIYDFDIYGYHIALITNKIQTYKLKPHG